MVRGTNKIIIEVNDTQNKYFEKAILFVKDNIPQGNDVNLNTEAKKYMDEVKIKNKFVRRKNYLTTNIGLILGSAVCGALLSIVLMQI